MSSAWLRPALMTLLLASLPTTAAATSTGTGSGTGTGSDTGMGTDTGTGTGTGGDGGSGSTTMECSECTDSTDVVQIVSPANGATVATTVDVHVTAPYTCACNGCACAPRPPFTVNVRVDGMTVINCSSDEEGCNTEDQTFSIELEPGTHTLDAVADHDGHPEFSDPIEVTVPGAADDTTGSPPPPPPPPAASTGESGSDSTGAPAADGGGGGCGCRADDPQHTSGGLPALLLGLLGLGVARRRPARVTLE